jgi:hypothetical protein
MFMTAGGEEKLWQWMQFFFSILACPEFKE